MVAEISVQLPNIPGQFSRVLKALGHAQVSIRAFSVDQDGALSRLHLLFADAAEAERACEALEEYSYETFQTELLLLSCPDALGTLLRITDVLAGNNINVDYGYTVLGQTESGEVFFALKVADGRAAFALECLAAYGITEHNLVNPATAPVPSAS